MVQSKQERDWSETRESTNVNIQIYLTIIEHVQKVVHRCVRNFEKLFLFKKNYRKFFKY